MKNQLQMKLNTLSQKTNAVNNLISDTDTTLNATLIDQLQVSINELKAANVVPAADAKS